MRTSLIRTTAAAAIFGSTILGVAWASIGLTPVDPPLPEPVDGIEAATGTADPTTATADPTTATAGHAAGQVAERRGEERPPAPGGLEVGADVTSLAPDPALWRTEGCPQLDQGPAGFVDHLDTPLLSEGRLGWPVDPDCVYLGGYGIGPARAATAVDDHAGLNVRSLAISNGDQTVIWQMVDMVGFFSHYRPELCDRCGIADIRQAISSDTGIPVENLAIGSTHTHAGADGYGAWGGIPRWYREQIRDQVISSAKAAYADLQPAVIEVGSVEARPFNRERRDLYHSTPDFGAVWLQARTVPRPRNDPGAVIATLVNFAAHPTVLGSGNTELHGDWPATASKALGESFGGTGLVFQGGLGNVSPNGGEVVEMGQRIAAFVARDIERGGTLLQSTDIAAASTTISHPITNWAETGLGLAGLLDRDFLPGPAAGGPGAYEWRKSDQSPRACVTAGPLTVTTEISGFRIGELTVLTTPGEIFSAISQVLKSEARHGAMEGGQTMVFAQTQDSLGYIIQSFEVDPLGGAAEYVPEIEVAEYEETFMLDRCFGDHVLDTALQLHDELGG